MRLRSRLGFIGFEARSGMNRRVTCARSMYFSLGQIISVCNKIITGADETLPRALSVRMDKPIQRYNYNQRVQVLTRSVK